MSVYCKQPASIAYTAHVMALNRDGVGRPGDQCRVRGHPHGRFMMG